MLGQLHGAREADQQRGAKPGKVSLRQQSQRQAQVLDRSAQSGSCKRASSPDRGEYPETWTKVRWMNGTSSSSADTPLAPEIGRYDGERRWVRQGELKWGGATWSLINPAYCIEVLGEPNLEVAQVQC